MEERPVFELTCVATGPSRSSNRVSGAEQVDGCEEEEAPRGNHVAFVGRESHHTCELFKAGPAIGWLFKICFGIARRNLAALAQQLRLYWESLSNQLLQHQANSHVFLVIFSAFQPRHRCPITRRTPITAVSLGSFKPERVIDLPQLFTNNHPEAGP